MAKVNAKDRFIKVCDYITASDIVSNISSFMCDDDLHDFCDFLIEEFDIDIEEDYDEEYNEDED
jgi:hypothetical protein